jgi:hypothetical protein
VCSPTLPSPCPALHRMSQMDPLAYRCGRPTTRREKRSANTRNWQLANIRNSTRLSWRRMVEWSIRLARCSNACPTTPLTRPAQASFSAVRSSHTCTRPWPSRLCEATPATLRLSSEWPRMRLDRTHAQSSSCARAAAKWRVERHNSSRHDHKGSARTLMCM